VIVFQGRANGIVPTWFILTRVRFGAVPLGP